MKRISSRKIVWSVLFSTLFSGGSFCTAATTWNDAAARTGGTITDGLLITSAAENTVTGAYTLSGSAGEDSALCLNGAGALTIASGGSLTVNSFGLNLYSGTTLNVNAGGTLNVNLTGRKIRLSRTGTVGTEPYTTTVNWAGNGIWNLGSGENAIFMSEVNGNTTNFNQTAGSFELKGGEGATQNLAFKGTTNWNISGGTATFGAGSPAGTSSTLTFGGGTWSDTSGIVGNINLSRSGTFAVRGNGNMVWGASDASKTMTLALNLGTGSTFSTSRTLTDGSALGENTITFDGGTFEAVKPDGETGAVTLSVPVTFTSVLTKNGANFNVAEGVTLNYDSILTCDSDVSTTDARTLTKTGAGTLKLNVSDAGMSAAALTFNINGGKWIFSSETLGCEASNTRNATVNVASGATWEYNLTKDSHFYTNFAAGSMLGTVGDGFTIRGRISGDMTVAYGTVTLGAEAQAAGMELNSLTVNSGAQINVWFDYRLGKNNGTLTLNGGTYKAVAGHEINAARTLNVNSGTFYVDGTHTLTVSPVIHAGTGAVISKTGTGTLLLKANNSTGLASDSTLRLQEGTLQFASAVNVGVAAIQLSGGTLNPTGDAELSNSVSLTANSTVRVENGKKLTLNGSLTRTGGNLTKTGAGTLVLGGNNSALKDGTFLISGGVLSIASQQNVGAMGLQFGGGSLRVTDTTELTQTLEVLKNSENVYHSFTLDVEGGKTLTLGTGFNMNFQANTAANIHKTGAGKVILGAAGGVLGFTTFIDAGSFEIQRGATISGGKTINLGANGTLIFNTNGDPNTGVVLNAAQGGKLQNLYSGTLVYTGTASGDVILERGSFSFTGNTSGLNSVTVNENSVLVMNNALKNGDTNLIFNNGTLRATENITCAAASLTDGTKTAYVEVVPGKTLTIKNGFGANYMNGSFHKTGTGTLNFGINGDNNTGGLTLLTYIDAGTLGLYREETMTGNKTMYISDGAAFNYLGNSADPKEITVNAASGTAILNVGAGKTWNAAGLMSAADGAKFQKKDSGTLKLSGSTVNTADFLVTAGTLELAKDSGKNAARNITAAENGRILVSGTDQSLGGTVTLAGGMLQIASGKTFTTSEITVSGAAADTVSNIGGGTAAGNIHVTAGILSPGSTTAANSIGTLTQTGDTTLEAGTLLKFDAASGSSYDKFLTSGALNFLTDDAGISAKIDVVWNDGVNPHSLTNLALLSADDGIEINGAAPPADYDWNALLVNPYLWNVNYDVLTGSLSVGINENAIPEPAAWLLLILGAALLRTAGIGKRRGISRQSLV